MSLPQQGPCSLPLSLPRHLATHQTHKVPLKSHLCEEPLKARSIIFRLFQTL